MGLSLKRGDDRLILVALLAVLACLPVAFDTATTPLLICHYALWGLKDNSDYMDGLVSRSLLSFGAVALICSAFAVSAASLYVDVNGTNALAPYTNWATAATCIQDAIDAAEDGDRVLVADGTYGTGGHVLYGVTNRVTITRAINVESVHGPATTTILGFAERDRFGSPVIGPSNVRCAY